MPHDNLVYYIDGEMRGQLAQTDFERLLIPLPPGPHNITFSYQYNPVDLDALPPKDERHIGASYIDNVYFLPAGVTLAPTGPPTTSPVTPSSSTTTPTEGGSAPTVSI